MLAPNIDPTKTEHGPQIRNAVAADLSALIALERASFRTDVISSRSFARFLHAPSAGLIVATTGKGLAGYALVLFRSGSTVARLYSIAVSADASGRGIAIRLLVAAEQLARSRHCATMRLEVQDQNAAAIALYRKSGYCEFGRHAGYYEDGGTALRFEKKLVTSSTAHKDSSSPVALVAR